MSENQTTPEADTLEPSVDPTPQPPPNVPQYHEGRETESGDKFIETFFLDGPLGVTLRRRPDDGIVFIHEIIPDSQAINLDVQPLDELWAVGDSEIGETPLDKDAWNGLINFIKTSSRPLRLVWHRKPGRTLSSTAATAAPSMTIPAAPTTPLSTAAAVQAPRAVSPPVVANTIEVSPSFLELQRVVSRIVAKDEGKTSSKKVNPQSLLVEGRRILKQGDLSVSGKNSMWGSKKYEKRRVILCNDVFIITIPQSGNVFALEYVLDLPTCKIRSLGHVFGAVDEAMDPMAIDNSMTRKLQPEDLLFDIIAPPMGEITFASDSKEVKDVWVLSIYLAICDNVGESERVLGWRHQYMLGTMHSAVICRDEQRIRELIALCNDGKLSFLSVEQPDEDGYTPLHYACIMRLHTIIDLLHQATADVTATDRQGLTPLHWAAMQLDDYALSLLCQHVFDLDLYDPKERTPLTMCIIEGRDIHGKTDPLLLKECLTHMVSHKPNCHWQDKQGRTLVHYLAASWQYEALEVLLEADTSDVNAMDIVTGLTPLHAAVQARPMKKAIGEAQRIMSRMKAASTTTLTSSTSTSTSSSTPLSPVAAYHNNYSNNGGSVVVPLRTQSPAAGQMLNNNNNPVDTETLHTPYGVDTIRTLLKAGAKPNIRDCHGRTPLGLLLTDLEAQDRWLDREEILPAIAILISFGARVDLDSAGAVALKNLYPDLMVAAFVEKWTSLGVIDCTALGVGANHFELLELANNTSSNANLPLTSSTRTDSSSGNLAGGMTMSIDRRYSVNNNNSNSNAAVYDSNISNNGGVPPITPTKHPFAPDAAKQCVLCGFVYTLFRRQHHCRLCNTSCCDECSKKRCLVEGVQARACDVCYNRMHYLQEKAQEEARSLQRSLSYGALQSTSNNNNNNNNNSNSQNNATSSYANSSNGSQQDKEKERKLRLFGSSNSNNGGSSNNSSSQKMPSQQQQQSVNSQASVSRTMQTMNETHERLQERGEKLSRVAERSEEMANQANEFARLAKMLNEQQKSRWF